MVKVVVGIICVLILFSLFRGLFYLVKDKGQGKRVVHSLAFRVSLSLALIAFLLVAAAMGWITPHTLGG